MKVAYLVSRYPAVNHTYILREVRGLRALGMDVRVASILAPDRPAECLGEEEREEAARTFYVRPRGAARLLLEQARFLMRHPGAWLRAMALGGRLSRWNARAALRHALYIAEAIAVGGWMGREGVAHAHTHFASTPALFLKELFPVTISATIHGPAEFVDPEGFLLPEKIHAASFIVAISSFGKSQLMRVSPHGEWGKIFVSRLGVNPDEYVPGTARGAGNRTVILSVGQLSPAKGFPVLIEACGLLLKKGRNIHLRIVGDGQERSGLEQLIQELGIGAHVTLEGALAHEKVRDLYREADVFAMASFAEGIPVVLMEAMALGIPCVATWITGIPELIEHGVSGLLAQPSDVTALAAALERLLDDPVLCATLATAARARIVAEYDTRRNVEQLSQLFSAMV